MDKPCKRCGVQPAKSKELYCPPCRHIVLSELREEHLSDYEEPLTEPRESVGRDAISDEAWEWLDDLIDDYDLMG